MKTLPVLNTALHRLLMITSVLCILFLANSHAIGANHDNTGNIDSGYSALKLFLQDEQHLTFIRRVKTVITFEGISEISTELIDDIADSSEQALEELDRLAAMKPDIVFMEFSEESIGKATLDSMRIATAKEFLLDNDNFEKSLLLSQSQILRVISHLAVQLEEKETNAKRKAWLSELAQRYEKYYQLVIARISITGRADA
jgi:hypothetical protein